MITGKKNIFVKVMTVLLIVALSIPATMSTVNADTGASVSLGKSAKIDGDLVEVSIDLTLEAEKLEYTTPKDYIFVIHSTGSSNAWPGKAGDPKISGRQAIINAIDDIWQKSPASTITFVAYGRIAFTTNINESGLGYDYVDSYWNSHGRAIGNTVLGYVNPGSGAATQAQEEIVERSFYNQLDYYRITKNQSETSDSIDTYNSWYGDLSQEDKQLIKNNSPSGDYIEDAITALPYSDDTNTQAGYLEAKRLLETDDFKNSNNPKEVVLVTTGPMNRSLDDNNDIYISPASVIPMAELLNSNSASEIEINRAAAKATEVADDIKDMKTNGVNTKMTVITLDASPQTSFRGGTTGTPWSKDDLESMFSNLSSGAEGAGTTGENPYYINGEYKNPDSTVDIFEYMNQDYKAFKYTLPLPVLKDAINAKDFAYIMDSIGKNDFIDRVKLSADGSRLEFDFNKEEISKLENNSTITIKYYLKPNDPKILNTEFSVGDPNLIEFGFISPTIDEETGEIVYDAEKSYHKADPGTTKTDYTRDEPVITKYKATLNANGGKVSGKKTYKKNVTVGKKYGKLPNAKRKGYNFKGWYTKKKGGKKVTSKTVFKSEKNITLYARWAKNGKIKSAVTLRSKPTSASKAKIDLEKGQKVCILKKTKSGWYKIKAGDKTGYIYKRYIKKIK